MEEITGNLRLAGRLLMKRPAFAVAAVLTVSLGIALNTSTFGIVNALWFRPLPFRDGERLVVLAERNLKSGTTTFTSFATYRDWQEQSRSFEGMAALRERSCTFGVDDRAGGFPESYRAALISPGILDFMGFQPELGRSFLSADEQAGNRVVMISHQLWKNRLGSNPGIIGKEVLIDGERATVVGVLPLRFQFIYGGYQVVQPLAPAAAPQEREARGLHVVARLRSGTSLDQAQAEMSAVAGRIAAQYPQTNRDWDVHVFAYRKFLYADAIAMYPLLLAAAVLVLLVVCANISSLLLAQATARRREVAIRAALGAGRGRIARQMLSEGLLVALAGGTGAFLTVVWVRQVLVANYPELASLQIDFRVFAYTFCISLLAGVVFGLAPALSASRVDVNEALKEGSRTGPRGGSQRLRKFLVASQLAIALMLLAGAGLLVRTALKMREDNPGFRTEGLLTAEVNLRGDRYAGPERRRRFLRELERRVSALPGAEGVAFMSQLPLLGGGPPAKLEVSGAPGTVRQVNLRMVNAVFHEVLAVPLTAGRNMTGADGEGTEPVVMVNETLARAIVPGRPEDAVDQRIRLDGGPWRRVIGVSADIKQVLTRSVRAEALVPLAEKPPENIALVIRTKTDPRSLAVALRTEVAALDPALAVGSVQTIPDIVEGYFPVVMMAGIGAFSLAALALAATGLYGVVAYLVALRSREIGIRIALGADRRNVLRLVVGQSLRLAAWGVGAGLLGALAVSRVLARVLYGVSPIDPLVLGCVTALLAAVASLAGYAPARRAARVNPAIALREQ